MNAPHTPVRAYVGLGSNLESPRTQVERAFAALAGLPRTRLAGRSRLYRSDPLGPPGQPDYVNAVAALDTALEPLALLDALQSIEHAHGRVRTLRWGPRTLDLDLLLYGTRISRCARLTLPHPRLHERAFVLYPLADLAPGLTVPGSGFLPDLLRQCPYAGLETIGDDPHDSACAPARDCERHARPVVGPERGQRA